MIAYGYRHVIGQMTYIAIELYIYGADDPHNAGIRWYVHRLPIDVQQLALVARHCTGYRCTGTLRDVMGT